MFCIAYVAGVCFTAAPTPPSPDPFDARAVYSADTGQVKPWVEMIAHHPSAAAWSDVVERARRLPELQRLAYVNQAVNAAPYVPSVVNWRRFKIETPAELRLYGGSCEDYAVAKLFILEASGISPARLRVAVVRERGDIHGVLVVREGHRTVVLDNLRAAPVEFASTGYRLEYAISEAGWWRPKN
jgi:predicted transglutaminase-like cysteine proteinase